MHLGKSFFIILNFAFALAKLFAEAFGDEDDKKETKKVPSKDLTPKKT